MTNYKVTVGAGDSEQVTHFAVDDLRVEHTDSMVTIEAVDAGAVVGEVRADAYQTVTWQEVDRT